MQNIHVHIKPDKDYEVSYSIINKEHVEIDSVREKGSNVTVTLEDKVLELLEETVKMLSTVEEAIETEHLKEQIG